MTNIQTPVLQVAAKAVVVNDQGKVLIVREAATGKNNTKVGYWGLIGGRLEPGEAFLDALRREVSEEVGLQIEPLRPIYLGEWRPVIHDVPHQIIAIFMVCRVSSGTVVLSDEHDNYAWIAPAECHIYRMMEPDCFVIDELTLFDKSSLSLDHLR